MEEISPDGTRYPIQFPFFNGGGNYTAGAGINISPTKVISATAVTNSVSVLPTAYSLGIASGGSVDQSSNLSAAFNNANYSGIILDGASPNFIFVSGTVDCKGKVIKFQPGFYFTGGGTITNFIIDAYTFEKLWDTTMLIKPIGVSGVEFSLKWSGALGDNSHDDQPALQHAIDISIYNDLKVQRFPRSVLPYKLGKGLLWRRDSGGQGFTTPSGSIFLIGFSLKWDGAAYGISAGDVVLNNTNGNSFTCGGQKLKGFTSTGGSMYGQNALLTTATPYNIQLNPSYSFLSPGCSNLANAPHCGWVIDPFGDNTTATKYPDFTAYYVDNAGGSTDVKIETCWMQSFTVGAIDSPSGTVSNGEIVEFNDCWLGYNMVSFATCGSQQRTVVLRNCHCWYGAKYIIDCNSYGTSLGCPPLVENMNIAASNRYLCNLNSNESSPLIFKNLHAELLYGLGGRFGANAEAVYASLVICEGSFVNLTGSKPASQLAGSGGLGINQARTIFQGYSLTIKDSELIQYGSTPLMPINVHCTRAIAENTLFDFIPTNSYNPNTFSHNWSFKDCEYVGGEFGDNKFIGYNPIQSLRTAPFTSGMKMVTSFGVERTKIPNNSAYCPLISKDVVGVPLSAPITVSSVDSTVNMTAQFTLSTSSTDFLILLAGDTLLYSATDEYGNTVLTTFGNINAINNSTGVISLTGIANVVANGSYSVTIYRNEFLIPCVVVGNATSGNNTLTSCFTEAGEGMVAGTPIYSPYFPLGTTIVSYNIGTSVLTLSAPALSSPALTNFTIDIISSNWLGNQYGQTPNLSDTAKIGNKRGDKIYNDRPDLNPSVSYYLCNKSGITSTATQPAYNTYN